MPGAYMASGLPFAWGFAQPVAWGAISPPAAQAATNMPYVTQGVAAFPRAADNSQPTATEAAMQLTTVMMKNIPNNYDQNSLFELLSLHGFYGQCDFIYLPLDFKSRVALGYAFLNFTSHAVAVRAFSTFDGFTTWKGNSSKVCKVAWSETHQGQEANIRLVQNSPMNRRRVPDMFKPMIFKHGKRVKFPPPANKPRK